LSVIQNREQYEWTAQRYHADPILHWQKPVVREFIPLMPLSGTRFKAHFGWWQNAPDIE